MLFFLYTCCILISSLSHCWIYVGKDNDKGKGKDNSTKGEKGSSGEKGKFSRRKEEKEPNMYAQYIKESVEKAQAEARARDAQAAISQAQAQAHAHTQAHTQVYAQCVSFVNVYMSSIYWKECCAI